MTSRTAWLAGCPRCPACGTPMRCQHTAQRWTCTSTLHPTVQVVTWKAAANAAA